MFSNLIKKNSLSNWNSKNDVIFAKTTGSDSEWLITSKSLINYFDNTIGTKFYTNTLGDAVNNVLKEDAKRMHEYIEYGRTVTVYILCACLMYFAACTAPTMADAVG